MQLLRFLKIKPFRAGIIFCAIAVSTTLLEAQPVFKTYYSLEGRVAQAQALVRGRVICCSNYVGGYREDGTQRPDGFKIYTITVKVDDILKGRTPTTLQFSAEASAEDKRYQQWESHRTSFLFFIGDGAWSNLGGAIWETNRLSTIRLGKSIPAENGYSSDPPVYLMNFTSLTNAKAILAEARKFAKIKPQRDLQFHKFDRFPNGPLWTSLLVPVQPTLEKVAKHLIAAPEDFAAWTKNPPLRWELGLWRRDGVDALRYFKSKNNVRLLKSLLDDSESYLAGQEHGITLRRYPVRSTAYEVLKSWAIDVPRTVTEEPVPTQPIKSSQFSR
jgi:hypothetical protein